METLPTERDALPDDAEVKQVDCPDCGTPGYVVPEAGPTEVRTPRCEDCIREDFREDLAEDLGTRLGTLDRIDRRGLLPFRRQDGTLITDINVERGPPGEGNYLRSLTEIVERDCPECGHDRADAVYWRIWTAESGKRVRCRACDHIIKEESSL